MIGKNLSSPISLIEAINFAKKLVKKEQKKSRSKLFS